MLYFDHNSTTPVDSRVADIVDNSNRAFFGNASSTHMAGQNARHKLEKARRSVARRLGALESEIVFTSGGTESNNLALRGQLSSGMHAVTSAIEHPSVLEPFRQMERDGIDVTYVHVDVNGSVDVSDIENALRPNTALVSLMTANNETGAIQPIADVASLLHERRMAGQPIIFHSDGVQALGKMDLDLRSSGVDLLSLSGHKIYAPKGFGALYVRKGTHLRSLHLGGRHEHGLRAGTENVAGAVGFECALGLLSSQESISMAALRDEFERQLLAEVPDAKVNALAACRLPNTSNIWFPGISGEALLIALDMRGICVSTGSACSSGSVEPSHVLIEMGLSVKEARACIRFSFGRGNTPASVAELVQALSLSLGHMREKQLV